MYPPRDKEMWFKISSSRGITKGEDLEQLTRDMQSWELSKSLDTVTMEVRCRTRTRCFDWKSPQANEFLHAIAAMQCRRMEIHNFLDVPLPILQTCLQTSHDKNDYDNSSCITICCTAADSMRIASINNTKRTIHYDWKPFWGKRLHIEIDTQSIHWRDFWIWLQRTTSVCHDDSHWKHLEIHLLGNFDKEQLLQQCSSSRHCLERLFVTTTASLTFYAPDLVSSKNHTRLLTLLERKQEENNNSHYDFDKSRSIHVHFYNVHIEVSSRIDDGSSSLELWIDDDTDWIVLMEWLDRIMGVIVGVGGGPKERCSWRKLTINVEGLMEFPFMDKEMKQQQQRQHSYEQVLKVLSSLQIQSFHILSRYRRSWYLSDMIIKLCCQTNVTILEELFVHTKDDYWIQNLEQRVASFLMIQRFIIQFEDNNIVVVVGMKLLQNNPFITYLQLPWWSSNDSDDDDNNMHDSKQTKLLQALQLCLRLNKNGKRLLVHRHSNTMSPKQWVWLLECINHEQLQPLYSECTNDGLWIGHHPATAGLIHYGEENVAIMQLSCLYFFVRNYATYYVTLATTTTTTAFSGGGS